MTNYSVDSRTAARILSEDIAANIAELGSLPFREIREHKIILQNAYRLLGAIIHEANRSI